MFQSNYNRVLTIVLVIVIIATLGLLGFLGYDYYSKYISTKKQSDIVDEFISEAIYSTGSSTSDENEDTQLNSIDLSNLETQQVNSGDDSQSSSTTKKKVVKTYEGFPMLGTLEAPKTKYKLPILDQVTDASLNKSIGVLVGPGLNEVGNTVIVGHNYRNGQFFANNDKLNVGDKIYITDLQGRKVTYEIYEKSVKEANDASFYTRDTNGKAEITLSTCTNDGKKRIVIFAVAKD